MQVSLIGTQKGKIKKIKPSFNWIVLGFAEIYAAPFFIYGLYLYGMLFLAVCLLSMYCGVPHYQAAVPDPYLLTDPGRLLPLYTPRLIISSAANIFMLITGSAYANRMRAAKLIKKYI